MALSAALSPQLSTQFAVPLKERLLTLYLDSGRVDLLSAGLRSCMPVVGGRKPPG